MELDNQYYFAWWDLWSEPSKYSESAVEEVDTFLSVNNTLNQQWKCMGLYFWGADDARVANSRFDPKSP